MPKEPKQKDGAPKWFRLIILAALIIAAVIVVIALNLGQGGGKFHLSEEYYGSSEMIAGLTTEQYEDLIAQKKSFVVMVDKPDCVTTVAMRENMAHFPDNMRFSYYQFMWSQMKNSSLHGYVTFVPSVALIREGKVVAWLRADSDEDTEYFNSAEALQRWLAERIEF